MNKFKTIVKDYYSPENPRPLDKTLMVERSGFIPRSVMLAKMAVQGELNKVINDFENNKLFGRSNDDDLNKLISPLAIKDLNRTETVKAIRNRSYQISESFNALSKLEKERVNLMRKVDDVKLSSGNNIDDPSPSSE